MTLRLLLRGSHTHFGERTVCMFVSMLNGKTGRNRRSTTRQALTPDP
jgi:hypothetical protein